MVWVKQWINCVTEEEVETGMVSKEAMDAWEYSFGGGSADWEIGNNGGDMR